MQSSDGAHPNSGEKWLKVEFKTRLRPNTWQQLRGISKLLTSTSYETVLSYTI